MPEYIVNLWLDGYDTEEQMEKACDEFIYDQLNFTASSVRVKRSDYDTLLTKYNELNEAVKWEKECRDLRLPDSFYHYPDNRRKRPLNGILELGFIRAAAHVEVNKLLEEK